ncbi:hypothetical protein PUNSTDRAFT_131261 [Punctularia strigosozonata HHB-11173 SS5]|uniref:uncharacterized protein n=1 Tax=Punctularia strigosozonata (strain HHB-11173) TaxID=741275 RepID=UPI0004417BD8|nr:uncharacterized protein PUNSTDRAFT_131261 [Punctularia strigosozonata HHB-11173 SS5]EIN13036.1 hypothetical protein PUNSTDRAFT_131261 [Punctularia strigosozonata HHB-11173 SS5]
MAITTNESTFLGFGFEMTLYGIYLVVFSMAIMLLTWKRRTESISVFYVFFCCLLFSCCSIHALIRFRYMYKDLVQERNPEGTIQAGTPALRTADALVTLTDFFAELVLCYRLWSIWDQNYFVVALPFLMSLAFVSCAMTTIGLLISHPAAAIVPKSEVHFGTSAFAIPLAFNFLVTSLIVGRIWWKGRQHRGNLRQSGGIILSNGYLKDAMMVVVESGMLYLVVQLVLTVLFALNHPAQILLSDIATQVYGIAPTLIFVRVGLGDTTRTMLSSNYDNQRRRFLRSGGSGGSESTKRTNRTTGTEKTLPMIIPIHKSVHRYQDNLEQSKSSEIWQQTVELEPVSPALSV